MVLAFMGWLLFWPKPDHADQPQLPTSKNLELADGLITQLDRDTVAALLPP
jgi:hypothetical protein